MLHLSKKGFPLPYLHNEQDGQKRWCEEHDAGDLGIQSSRAEASEDTKLYPSWYKANSWQVTSPCVALSDDPVQVPDCPALVVRDPPPQCPPSQPQFQQAFPLPAWMGAGFLPMASETPASHFGRVTSETPSGLLHQTGDGGSDVGEHSANQGSMITISPQVSLPLGFRL